MAYNDEALKAKLSTLNETQESIVAASQWITFHRRHAERIASVWLTRLRDSQPAKRLVYIYLVNDIVQNARARKRSDFPDAFSPLMPEAIQQAYRSASSDVQTKIRRVVDVWKTRATFEEGILSAIQSRLDEIDKTKGSSGKKTLMGNSLFQSSSTTGMPKELQSLGPLQNAVTKAVLAANPMAETATAEYTKLNDPTTPRPSQPVFAANLSSLIKKLASAEASLNDSIKAQQSLIADLKRITEEKEATLKKDEEVRSDLSNKRTATENSKREVEDSIMRGLSSNVEETADLEGDYASRPDVEELTPEPEDPPTAALSNGRNLDLQNILSGFGDKSEGYTPASYATGFPSSGGNPGVSGPSAKKRKFSHDEDQVPDMGGMGMTEVETSGDLMNQVVAGDDVENEIPQYDATDTTIEEDIDALIQGQAGAHQS